MNEKKSSRARREAELRRRLDELFLSRKPGAPPSHPTVQEAPQRPPQPAAMNETLAPSAGFPWRRFWLSGLAALLLGSLVLLFWYVLRPRPAAIHLALSRSWNAYGKIVATPFLAGQPGAVFLGVGDQNGFFSVFEGKSGRVSLRYHALGEIVSSPLYADLGDGPAWILAKRGGQTHVLRPDGVWLWKSRPEDGLAGLVGRPARILIEGVPHLVLADLRGQIACLEGRHGIPRWLRRDAASAGSMLFASPLAWDGKVFFASTRGDFFAVDAATGRDLWRTDVSNEVRASPVLVRLGLGRWAIGVVDLEGGWVLCRIDDGGVIARAKLEGGSIASPIAVEQGPAASDRVYVATRQGALLRLDPTTAAVRARYQAAPGDGFRSSPIAFDADGDGAPEILAFTGAGRLLLLDAKKLEPRLPPYPLGGEITASPVAADVDQDGQNEIVAALESGEILLLSLTTTPKADRGSARSPVTGFRGDGRNTGRFPAPKE
ncbi:MAG: PQQ-binding-like beta-propeller repeat protein [Spirochaetes bacterium]|nr:PQQ-binding-like beta-propeller repeat protein [Spirochaetota bacterium]